MMHDRICTPAASVIASIHEGGAVLMDLASGKLFSANRTGAEIWQAVEAGQSLETIAGQLSRVHGVPPERAHEYTERFVAALGAHALVQVR